jgi:inorganic pyrophosphatase
MYKPEMNLWSDLAPGSDVPRRINVVVEIPKRSRNKYEFDCSGGYFKLDRVLYSSLHYPGDYGFVPQTLHDDGDPLDVLIMVNEPTFPGCVIEARPIGLFRLLDHGKVDDKILAVPAFDPSFKNYHTLQDVPPHFLMEVEHFFAVYKDLEQKKVEVVGWEGVECAYHEIERAMRAYRQESLVQAA